jgi:hypothetical protein
MEILAALWSSKLTRGVGTGPAAGYRTLFDTVRRLTVGRRLTVRLMGDDVKLTIKELDAYLDVRSLSVGQLSDVHIVAADICCGQHKMTRAQAHLRNVHPRPATPPVLVAAPVAVALDTSPAAVQNLFRGAVPRLDVELAATDIVRLRWLRLPNFGYLDVVPRVDGSTLWLKPQAIAVGTKRWRVTPRAPSVPVRLPALPCGLRLSGLHLTPDLVQLTGTMPHWQVAIPRGRLQQAIAELNKADRPVNLT